MGPWSRSFITALAGRVERPADAALAAVRDLTIEVGVIHARVGECTVTLGADPVPPRIWAAMARFARGRGPLEEAVAGRIQSVHLEHLMAEDWGEPLVPRTRSITHGCSCHGGDACEHIVALAYAFVAGLEQDPSVLLRWRGCVEDAPQRIAVPSPESSRTVRDPWQGADTPAAASRRTLAAGAVLKRLGASGVQVGDEDVADVLEQAYTAFSEATGHDE